MIMRALRPDRMTLAILRWVGDVLGSHFMTAINFDLALSFEVRYLVITPSSPSRCGHLLPPHTLLPPHGPPPHAGPHRMPYCRPTPPPLPPGPHHAPHRMPSF